MRNHYVRWLSLLAFLSFVQLALAQSDDCSTASAITDGSTVSGTSFGATNSGAGDCGATDDGGPDVWYQFVGNGGTATLSTCNQAGFDTKISIFSGTCGALVCEDGNDDGPGCSGFTSEVTIPTVNGTTYFVMIHGFFGDSGPFDLSLDFGPPPPPPPSNDDCSGAQAISIAASGSVNGDVTTATTDNTIDCGASNGSGYGVWYSFVGTGDLLELTTCGGASWDTKIFVFSGSCGALSCVTGDDDADDGCGVGFSLQSKVEFLTNTGTTYYVLVETFSSSTSGVGPFTLSYTVTPVIPPANDDCTNAEPIAAGDVKTGDTEFAADESGNPSVGACGGVTYDGAGGVWYVYSGDGDAVTFATCGSSYDTKLNVYQAFPGNCGFLFCVAGGDDECGNDAQVSVNTSIGSDYYVLVHGSGVAARGPYSLVATKGANNDDCSGAIAVSCGDVITGSTIGAGIEAVPSCPPNSYTAGGVWYKIQGNGSAITVDLSGSTYDTRLFIYEGTCGFAALTCVTSDDDGGTTFLSSKASWFSNNGTEYFILVSGFGTDQGNFNMTIDCPPPVFNNSCAGAITVTDGVPVSGSTSGASPEAVDPPFCGTSYSGSNSVWYKYTATAGGPTDFSLCDPNTTYDTKIHVYSGSCGSLVCEGGNDDGGGSCGLDSRVEVCTTPGVTYYIMVSAWSSSGSGNFTLNVNNLGVTPPANDDCSNAIPVAIGSTTPGTTIGACPDDNGTCGTGSQQSGAVWYSFVGEGDWMNVTTCNAVGFDTRLQIFTGSCGALVCEDGNDDDFGGCTFSGLRSKVIFFADEGVTYYVKVFGFSTNEGDFELTVDLAPEVNILQEYDLNNPSFVVILNGVPGPSDFVPISQHNNVNSLLLVRYPGGAGQITGTLAPRGTQLARWDVNIQLRDRKNWTDWNAGGGLYKGSGPVAAANHQTWSFSEIAPGSYLSGHPGTGYAGDTLWLAHTPANMLYGMQRGLGANDFNGNFGISGWFTFSGAYSGTGDVNATITNVDACENSPVGCSPAPVSPMVVALEGATEGNSMRTSLSTSGVLSQSQPFNNSVYNYSGTESFTGTATNAVDWVLVSLRDPANPRNVVARRAALVGQDGMLMNGDGTTFNLRDVGNVNQNYYIAVSSNNHVDVMTADPVSLKGMLDLTKGAEMIYNDPSVQGHTFAKLPNGKIGLVSGDSNGDGVVDAADIADIQNHFHEAGAKAQDMDYDGLVTPQDLRKMMQNQGAASHVPR